MFDHSKVPSAASIGGGSPSRKPLGDLYDSNEQARNDKLTAQERYEQYLRYMESQPESRSVIGYDETRGASRRYESSSQYGNSLDDSKYYRSDFRHPTESHSHSTYRAPSTDGKIA